MFRMGNHKRVAGEYKQEATYSGSVITLSPEMIRPLLGKELNVSERLVQQFGVAKTVRDMKNG